MKILLYKGLGLLFLPFSASEDNGEHASPDNQTKSNANYHSESYSSWNVECKKKWWNLLVKILGPPLFRLNFLFMFFSRNQNFAKLLLFTSQNQPFFCDIVFGNKYLTLDY